MQGDRQQANHLLGLNSGYRRGCECNLKLMLEKFQKLIHVILYMLFGIQRNTRPTDIAREAVGVLHARSMTE